MKVENFLRFLFFVFYLGFIPGILFSANIKGNIKITEDWQPVLFLASINSPENLNVASPDFIISKTFINPNGSFEFPNVVLSVNPQFYRFYLVKNENSLVEFNVTGDRNFAHFILDNSSDFSMNAEIISNSLKITDVSNDVLNQKLLGFEATFSEKKKQFDKDLSRSQKEFLAIDLENYIREFVDSSGNSILGLYALYKIEEKETDFLRNSDFYFNFQKKINQQYPQTKYTEEYNDLLDDLIGFRQMVCEIPGVAPKWKNTLLLVESIVLIVLLIIIFVLLFKLKNIGPAVRFKNENKGKIDNLTQKEKEILDLLTLGKSNKEIAIELFIELSTVKSHLSSIYKQLNVAGRKEAIQINKQKK